jgi:DNA-binding beta-propeller fold protein YncE
MSPNGQELYAASQCGGGRDPVFVIDTSEPKVVDSIPGLDVGGSLALGKDGKTLYVSRTNASSQQLDGDRGSPFSVVDIQSRNIVNTVCLRVSVDSIALSHDDAYLFVSNGNNLSVFDARQVRGAGNAALLNDITVKSDKEAAMEGIGVAEEGGVYIWISNTPSNTPQQPRLFMYNPSGLIKPPR